jgi:glycosyltransferase involved in cell wall biosynthesis
MRIGIIGTRGIPNQYGGYEQFVEFAAPALVQRGHEVYVYNSSLHPYQQKTWKGVNIIIKYDPENKIGTAGQFFYDLNCILDSRSRKFDVILQLGYTSSSIWSSLFPKSSLLMTNMDGLEWRRSKYSKNVQQFLKKAEKWAALKSDYLIADSKGIQEYLLKKYNRESAFIAYGAELVVHTDENVVIEKGLKKYEYDLLIARMEPENNIETIIQGHIMANSSKPLIIIGNYKNAYGSFLYEKYRSNRIQFWGAVYDFNLLNSLRYYTYFYFHGHSVGGTNPSLLEAMASYAPVVANDNIFNRSVLENDAFYFSTPGDIAAILNREMDREEMKLMIENNAARIRDQYSWKHIINLLENYLLHAVDVHKRNRQ